MFLALIAATGACGRSAAPDVVCLSQARPPAADLGPARSLGHLPGGLEARLSPDGENGGWWLEWDLPAEAWVPGPVPGLALGPRPFQPLGRSPGGGQGELLLLDGEPLPRVPPDPEASALDPARVEALPVGSWTGGGDVIYLRVGPEGAPAGLVASVFVDAGYERDGTWHVRGAQRAGRGWILPTGARATWPVRIDPEGGLWLAAAAHGPRPIEGAGDTDGQPVELVVRLDGEPVFRRPLTPSPLPGLERFELRWSDAPSRPRARSAELTIEAEGAAALTLLHAPRLVGGARSARDPRPDLLVFLADTLRADTLELYDGRPGRQPLRTTPFLDGFQRESLAFERAWSPSSWTLPSQATLLTGLLPIQHGARATAHRLPSGATTLADVLHAAGYRTEAVTDGAYVSATFGLHHGFELFDEAFDDLEHALARGLDAIDWDDGRPLFLYLQTYAVHTPFEPGPAARARVGASERDWLEVLEEAARHAAEAEARGLDRLLDPGVRAGLAELERLYLAGVIELDQGFERFWGELERRGWPARGVLAFTSDHGEAFGEHGQLLHGATNFEEETRIPLLLRGPGMAPRVAVRAASLADLAVTLAELGGARPLTGGPGRSLLAPQPARPLFLEVSPASGAPSERAAVDRGGKWIWPLEGEPVYYDLEADPGELSPLTGDRERARALLSAFERWGTRARLDAEATEVSAADEARLRGLGYLGD